MMGGARMPESDDYRLEDHPRREVHLCGPATLVGCV